VYSLALHPPSLPHCRRRNFFLCYNPLLASK
jgi:hypothetical protein